MGESEEVEETVVEVASGESAIFTVVLQLAQRFSLVRVPECTFSLMGTPRLTSKKRMTVQIVYIATEPMGRPRTFASKFL
jgi:hypothetical protein